MAAIDAVRERLSSLVAGGELVGFVLGVSHEGRSSLVAHGSRSIDGPHMTEDTQFAITSSTKPIAGVLAMRLVELGIVALDEPVSRHLPELASPRVLRRVDGPLGDSVTAERPITLRHLLTMTAGFGWVAEEGPLSTALAQQRLAPGPFPPPMGPDEYLRRLGDLPLASQPGQLWRYHTSSDVLGVLLSRAARTPVGELLREHILDPLGMGETGFEGDPARMATAYGLAADGGLEPFGVPEGVFTTAPEFESLAAGLVSTVPDQLRFLSALLDRRGAVLSRGSVITMTSDQLSSHQRAGARGFLEPGSGYGFQLEVRPDGSFGWAGGLGTIGYANPVTGRAAVLFTQQSAETPGTLEAFEAFWRLLR